MKVLILIFVLFFCISGFSQTIKYSYDAAGNRVLREIVLSRQKNIESENKQDSPVEEKLSGKMVKIYPNPTKGALKIEIENWDNDSSGNVYVYSANGALINQFILVDFMQIVDISHEPAGLYILKIDINKNSSLWRIIKE